MAKSPVNKKQARKRKNTANAKQREHARLITEALKELKDASDGVRIGVLASRQTLVVIAQRLQVVKTNVGLQPSVLNAVTNWVNLDKGTRVILNDLDRLDATWDRLKFESMDQYEMPVNAFGIARQYMELAELMNDSFIPMAVVVDESITEFITNGTEIELIEVGKPNVEHHEDGTTTTHSTEEAEEHLAGIMNPTTEEVEEALR